MEAAHVQQTRFLRDLVAGRRPAWTPSVEEGLAARAATEGLAGVVATAVDAGVAELTPRALDEVHAVWTTARTRSAVLDLELARLASSAASRPELSPPLLLKGPAVARRYGDPRVRTYVDIDLLVPERELEMWAAFLPTLGFSGPDAWQERNYRRYHHHVVYRRSGPVGPVAVEVHWSLFAERRARWFGYDQVVSASEASPWPAVRYASLPQLLVLLAIHLAHHTPEERRLIWIRDFIELADGGAVEAARVIAAGHNVSWALEQSLHAAEEVLEIPRWQARPERQRFGMARLANEDRADFLYHAGVMRELGWLRGLRYVIDRVDPRRFVTDGKIDRRRMAAWLARHVRRTRQTLRRRRRDR